MANRETLKILLLSTSSDTGGGPQVVYNLAVGLQQCGIEVAVALPGGGVYVDRLKAEQITVYVLPLDRLRVKTFWRLRELCYSEGFQLLHSHGKGAGLYARVSTLNMKLRHVHTFHGVHIALYSSFKALIYRGYEWSLSWLTDCFVHVSETEYQEAKKQHLYGARRHQVIYNGCEIPQTSLTMPQLRSQLRKLLKITPDAVIMLCVARFDPVKNHAWLIEAFKHLENVNVHLVLVGDGVTMPAAKQLVEQLGLESRIHFMGSRNDVADIMRGSDIFVLASLREGLPITLQEAMLARLPLLGNDTIGIHEPIQEGINGYLFKQPNIDSFVSAATKLISNPGKRQKLGRAGYDYAMKNYSMDEFITQHLSLYRNLVEIP